MAKTKIFELAKELGIQSRDIIIFLQKEGVEAKAAQSSIEEEAVQRVRKHFGKSEGEKRIVTEGEMRMGDMPEKKEVQKEIQAQGAKEQAQGAKEQAPAKKKKNIIFVSNPHNRKMQSQKQAGGREREAGFRKRRGGPSGFRPVRGKERRAFRRGPGTSGRKAPGRPAQADQASYEAFPAPDAG